MADKKSLLDWLADFGTDVQSLKSHAANVIANSEGPVDPESEQMVHVTGGLTMNSVFKKAVSVELLDAAKSEADGIRKDRTKAIAEAAKE